MRCTTFAFSMICAVFAAILPALAAAWTPYGNARYNYWIDVPPGFSAIEEAENGDGGTAKSPDGQAELAVWGGYLSDRDFPNEVKWRVGQEQADGWSVTYERHKAKWAVWSGSKDGRIFFERAIPVCDGAAAYFRLEYDKAAQKAFDPIVARLSKSLRAGDC